MHPIFGRYIKAHGFAIAIAALTFGCIFASDIMLAKNGLKQARPLDDIAADRTTDAAPAAATVTTRETYFRVRPLGQLIFSLVWVLAGTIFLIGLLFEKKETIFPFATIFSIDWSVILIQYLTRLERKSFQQLILSPDAVVLVVIPLYVGFTLAVLYKLFDSRQSGMENLAFDDLENGQKPVKFSLGEEFDDSWIS
ncbi:uncharacterized protein LOC131693680 [Topomyia yanbarensis]|uniref:uncharacterized protein LOC131693680 n=1 Tax=Topomyia yanbarensis TaxID=2498891 RepID=UPI00273C832A|nr:uncharacterized protein LOC131693680 [Topomyia yanbarensis]